MTANRARELADKCESLSEQYFYIYEASLNPSYRQKSTYYGELSEGLYIAAEVLENEERRKYGSRT